MCISTITELNENLEQKTYKRHEYAEEWWTIREAVNKLAEYSKVEVNEVRDLGWTFDPRETERRQWYNSRYQLYLQLEKTLG